MIIGAHYTYMRKNSKQNYNIFLKQKNIKQKNAKKSTFCYPNMAKDTPKTENSTKSTFWFNAFPSFLQA